jgi:hypothetical protein
MRSQQILARLALAVLAVLSAVAMAGGPSTSGPLGEGRPNGVGTRGTIWPQFPPDLLEHPERSCY